MNAAQLHGARDIRINTVSDPVPPGRGEIQIAVGAVGICGSDLHMYQTGMIGGIQTEHPLTLGHEFMGTVRAAGPDAHPAHVPGTRVAVDPQIACGRCENCIEGNPNLCPHHRFFGVFPTDGALCEVMNVPSGNAFAIPDDISDAGGTLLETLGVALHTIDLAKLKPAHAVAVIGCGPVGLLVMKLALLAGCWPVFAFDRMPWRTAAARNWGATLAETVEADEAVVRVLNATGNRGVDVAIEAAWANESIQQAADCCRPGGRLVLAGIPRDDQFAMKHSTARRKGLTIMMVRRMRHTYPRTIRLASASHAARPRPFIALDDLVSHTFPLDEAASAFELNADYRDKVTKVIIRP